MIDITLPTIEEVIEWKRAKIIVKHIECELVCAGLEDEAKAWHTLAWKINTEAEVLTAATTYVNIV